MKKTPTEEKILMSAKKVFYQKGLKGARMQEIADDAGVNKAMLHYYFRSKEKLFDKVFEQSVKSVTPMLMNVFLEKSELNTKIAHLVEMLIDFFLEEPYLSNFIVNELSQNPEKLFMNVLDYEGGLIGKIIPLINEQIQAEIEKGTVKTEIRSAELILNIMSLCLLPIMSQTVLQKTLGIDDERMRRFMIKRKQTVTRFVLDAIKP
ncbi:MULTISPECIES: TetR/AcrR family transcriptional regulator [unclassified Aureispira]|uniref:TetR/AcrR family transcriptional regulator n=1 Tax=unclassified Aureispira TaxID=2649989 RepID=UPI000AD4D6E2|nr:MULTISPECIES: TetR/AcrR family transcriptional regulator [unclassified Aureispira]WMX16386.1 TetR/AcrR family transcriptional regulator [Aureispira sp. CCB-E]